MKINSKLLPIKAHYFFFMAAMGPILPQINVFAKQLGISPNIMGFVTSLLPIFYVVFKPTVGYIADYFPRFRKLIFMMLILIMTLAYSGFHIIPEPEAHRITYQTSYEFHDELHLIKQCDINLNKSKEALCTEIRNVKCQYVCPELEFIENKSYEISGYFKYSLTNENDSWNFCSDTLIAYNKSTNCNFHCVQNSNNTLDCVSGTMTFWVFVILMCIGTIGFNVTNSISDAICFDVLGADEQMKYGAQRVWGSIGFGLAALVSGIAVNLFTDGIEKSIVPALIVMTIFSGLDLLSVIKLKLPKLTTTESIYKDVLSLIKRREIAIFLVFATLVGMLDSFIIYYMFWHLEEVAEKSGYIKDIKLIEGCVVAAECIGGEIIFFLISGKIIKKFGYLHCLSFCFFAYFIRLILISYIPNPWWLVPIEFFMQGASYALCYTCIVAYASVIAPAGTSATVQGIFAGMDDGLGFALGSLIGGQVYQYFGGAMSFRLFGFSALIMFILHIISSFLLGSRKIEKKNVIYENPSEQDKIQIES